MNNFLRVKSKNRAAHLRLAARLFSIMMLAFLWPARGEAQELPDLDVSRLSFTESDKSVTLTCSAEGDWTYKIGENVDENPFNGTLTGTKTGGKVFLIINNKEVTSDMVTYPKLILNDLNYTSDGAVFEMGGSKPVYIKTEGKSKLISTGLGTGSESYVIKSSAIPSFPLVIDGGSKGLEIRKEADYKFSLYGIQIYNNLSVILQGKITIAVHNTGDTERSSSNAIDVSDQTTLSYSESANIQCMAQEGFSVIGTISSPFLEWTFANAPAGKLEIRDANGQSFDPAITFDTDGKAKSFTISATKNTGYTLWQRDNMGYKQLMDAEGRTVFTATDDNLFSFSGMKVLPSNWTEYAQTAEVGPTGADVSVSDNTHYTVHTSAGLAWIAWVTNNGKNNTDGQNYPTNKGFAGCTVTLDSDISLAKPKYGVTDNFYAGWPAIGYGDSSDKRFKGIFDGGNHTISDLSMTGGVGDYTGLFSYIEEAVIKNLRVEGKIEVESTSNGNIRLGGIAGFASNSKIIACSNAVKITLTAPGVAGNESNIGGIVGQVSSSDIRNCWNEASLSGTSENLKFNIGGIAGRSNSPIDNCYSSGDVSGTGNSSSACASGGIVGYMEGSSTLSNCYATGSVSAINNQESAAACAGGIVGDLGSATVSNCLALNAGDKISATVGNSGTPYVGRVVGQNSGGSLSYNYASTLIKLKKDNGEAATPTTDIAADAINGANLYLNTATDAIASWAGTDEDKAFTAIGTDADGTLPQLKAIATTSNDNLPATYGAAIADQPAADMNSADYLEFGPLELPASGSTITLSCTDGKWSYKKGDGALTRFDGTVKMEQGVNSSATSLVVETATGTPTLTFDNVTISSTNVAALKIGESCTLTIHTMGDNNSSFETDRDPTIVNNGNLTVTGKGMTIVNGGAIPTAYGLNNSGTFTVTDPEVTSVIFHCYLGAINNTETGKLGNPWIEWRFADNPGKIAIAATSDSNQTPDAQTCTQRYFTIPVTHDKIYRLWKVTDGSPDEVRTLQKGKKDDKIVSLFPAPATNEVAVYTEVKDVKEVTISGTENFSTTECSGNDVTVGENGVLTIDAADAEVLNLTLKEGGQVVTTHPLKVDGTFSTTRTLGNNWIAFGSPVPLTASVGDNKLLYVGTGYNGTASSEQVWKNASGIPETGTETADLAADSPYLLATEHPATLVTFTATSGTAPLVIPQTAEVTTGNALADGVFLFQTNPNLSNLTLSDIYVLSTDGTRFDLHTGEYVLKPFKAYITANKVTRAGVLSLKVGGDIATGNEEPVIIATTRIWGTRGTLHISADVPADVMIVTPAGQILRTVKAPAGDTTLALPAGIYFVRCNDITYKVSL